MTVSAATWASPVRGTATGKSISSTRVASPATATDTGTLSAVTVMTASPVAMAGGSNVHR